MPEKEESTGKGATFYVPDSKNDLSCNDISKKESTGQNFCGTTSCGGTTEIMNGNGIGINNGAAAVYGNNGNGNGNAFIRLQGNNSRNSSNNNFLTDLQQNLSYSNVMQAEYEPLSKRLLKRAESKDPFFSLEFFPPRTVNGVANLLTRLERMGEGDPFFVDVTWHSASDPGSDKVTSSSSIAGACLNYCGLETMLHVACANSDAQECKKYLERSKKLGLRNILALRGDIDDEEKYKNRNELKYGAEFVKLIRQEYGDYFVVSVAGYPTGHPEAESYEADLFHLKEKVDAGSDFIVTQLFFSENDYFKFVQDCRRIGITVPIVPGVLPIQSYDSLRHMQKLSKLNVPQFIIDEVEKVKQNDEAVRNYGVNLAVKMCRNLLESGLAPGVHFYTLNRELATREILKQLGLWKQSCSRLLPWKPHRSHPKRCRENVRPIFWASRPKSYLYRTKDWDDFPNGRWGNSSSPAFGELKDYYMFYLKEKLPKDQLLAMWGQQLTSYTDVWKVFSNFIANRPNENGVKISKLPWSEESIAPETKLVQEQLVWCNENGILTINSQPNVNGALSTDPVVGWGNPNGYVYQKAYLEFFASKENIDALKLVLPKYALVSFHIINFDGSIDFTNSDGRNTPTAVTWGVFPGCEVAQPTVVDPISFHVWKDEAFDMWLHQWASLYEDGSQSREIIQQIHDTYCLVTLVDNDFAQPNVLWSLLSEMLEMRSNLTKSTSASATIGQQQSDQEEMTNTFDQVMACKVTCRQDSNNKDD